MHFSCDLLNQSVERAGRVVALELLDAAAKARKRLDDPEDAQALHDFRVAVRRLRTWLRASDAFLRDSTPKKAKRRLKRAARLTGTARDAEVHHEWLGTQRAHLGDHQRRGHTWLMKKIAEEKAESEADVAAEAAPEFDRAEATLSRTLRSYRVDVDDDKGDMPGSFAAEISELIREHGNKLSQSLAEVQSFEDAKKGHRSRIAGKRLRYLIEIVAECVTGGEQVVTELGEMQDLLGDWHDADVFSTEIAALDKETSANGGDVSAGLRALARRLERRGRKAFGSVKRRWCGRASFQPAVEAIVDELASRGVAVESAFSNASFASATKPARRRSSKRSRRLSHPTKA